MIVAQIGNKLRSLEGGRMAFMCPGCNEMHAVTVEGSPRWTWNGDADAPTFSPSVLVRGYRRITDDERTRIMAGETIEPEPRTCHSFVSDGQIQFLTDCSHQLAGQTVPLPDFGVSE
ncbi:ammonia monooxygenase [Paracoccus sp. NBH48]|nr:ammonia monooxygenase [Paracoccus sp. NBH48]